MRVDSQVRAFDPGAGRRHPGDPEHEKAPARRPETDVGPSWSFG